MAIHEECARQIVAVVHGHPTGGWCDSLERIMTLCREVGVDVNDPKWNEPSEAELAEEEPVVERANGEEVDPPMPTSSRFDEFGIDMENEPAA